MVSFSSILFYFDCCLVPGWKGEQGSQSTYSHFILTCVCVCVCVCVYIAYCVSTPVSCDGFMYK